MADLDLNIKVCTVGNSISHTSNAFSVVRHEFLELQIRIAMDKYLRSGVCQNEVMALQGLFNQNWCMDYSPGEWRSKRLYNEECDTILSGSKEILMVLYENTREKGGRSSDKKGVVAGNFVGMLEDHGFFNEKFIERYGYICFHMALISRVDEVNSNSHMHASFLEFLEALCRVIDLGDSNDLEKDIFVGYPDEFVLLEKKLESIISVFAYLKPRRNRR